MPRAILFGYDGVLVDRRARRRAVAERVLAEEGLAIPPGRLEGSWREEWLAAALREAAGARRELAARLSARAASYFADQLRVQGESWLPGAREFVECAAAAGLTLGLVTGVAADELRQPLERSRLRALLKAVVTGDDVETPKPSPAGHLEAIQRLNSDPPLPERLFHAHEIVAIEGSAAGLRAAAVAGLTAVALGPWAAGAAAADLRVGGFDELDLERLAKLDAEPR